MTAAEAPAWLILAFRLLDPIAIDQACLDLVYTNDPGRDHFIERVESRNGARTVEASAALGFGTKGYELIEMIMPL